MCHLLSECNVPVLYIDYYSILPITLQSWHYLPLHVKILSLVR